MNAFCTIMSEVELTVNSWPLKNVSDNIDDYETLTPNHFLLGWRSNNTPVINNKEVNVMLQHKWKAVQAATNMFWLQWTRGYLPMLTEQISPLKCDLVLLCDKNLKQSHWLLERIVETLPGSDNIVCVGKVQTKDSSYVWSVASLALLNVRMIGLV